MLLIFKVIHVLRICCPRDFHISSQQMDFHINSQQIHLIKCPWFCLNYNETEAFKSVKLTTAEHVYRRYIHSAQPFFAKCVDVMKACNNKLVLTKLVVLYQFTLVMRP